VRAFRRALAPASSILAVAAVLTVWLAVAPKNVSGMTKLKWIINGPAVATLVQDPTAQRFFENAAPFVIQRKTDPTALPPLWRAKVIRSFTSYAAMSRALSGGGIDAGVRGILYDNEHWKFTPDQEQRGHAEYTRMAAELVHRHGLLFIAAPAVDLTQVLAPGPAKRYDAYIGAGLARDAARYADVYEIQAQGSEKDVDKYASFVRAAAQQAREANPKVMVLAGLSTNPGGQSVTAQDVLAAIAATRSSLDGYWFNIPRPSEYCPRCNDFRPDIAIDVFKRLGSSAR
jgi:hypothetical protein